MNIKSFFSRHSSQISLNNMCSKHLFWNNKIIVFLASVVMVLIAIGQQTILLPSRVMMEFRSNKFSLLQAIFRIFDVVVSKDETQWLELMDVSSGKSLVQEGFITNWCIVSVKSFVRVRLQLVSRCIAITVLYPCR